MINLDIQVPPGKDVEILIIDKNKTKKVNSVFHECVLNYPKQYSQDCFIQLYEVN